MQCWQKSANDARQSRDNQRERENRRIRPDLSDWSSPAARLQEWQADPHTRTSRRRHRPLLPAGARQKLANDSTTARTQRHADRQFALPRRRPRQEQIGDVGTGNQQEQRDSSEKHHVIALGNVSLNDSNPTRHCSGNCAGSRCFKSAMIGPRSDSAFSFDTPGFRRPRRVRMPSTLRPR